MGEKVGERRLIENRTPIDDIPVTLALGRGDQ